MCRSIKTLRAPGLVVETADTRAAALQFVRKVSGFHKPSKKNQEAFDRAVLEIAAVTDRLLEAISTPEPAAPNDALTVAAP